MKELQICLKNELEYSCLLSPSTGSQTEYDTTDNSSTGCTGCTGGTIQLFKIVMDVLELLIIGQMWMVGLLVVLVS